MTPRRAGTGTTPDWRGRRRARAGGRVNVMFLLPFLLLPGAFGRDPAGMVLALGAFAVLVLAAWLTRDGVRAHEAYDARTVARRPALPRKILAAGLTGLGLGVALYPDAVSVSGPALVALAGAALHLGAFGLDPLSDKLSGNARGAHVAEAVARAEERLAQMRSSIAATGDRALLARVEGFAAGARRLFRTIERDPGRLPAARRYLGVYIDGACDAAMQYCELDQQGRTPAARRRFEALLDDLEDDFAARNAALMEGDRAAFEIEVDVLRERLRREGLTPRD